MFAGGGDRRCNQKNSNCIRSRHQHLGARLERNLLSAVMLAVNPPAGTAEAGMEMPHSLGPMLV